MGNFAEADGSRKERSIESITTRTAGEPIMAIVSLRGQRITVYDADGWIMSAGLGGKEDMRWSAISLVGSNVDTTAQGTTYKSLDAAVNEADLPNAKAALDRVIIPQDIIDQITRSVSPRSSLIISDEGPSPETGRSTEFVIVMSDEPHGGLAHRRHASHVGLRNGSRRDRFYWRSPFGNSPTR
jgi:hypothetical protein